MLNVVVSPLMSINPVEVRGLLVLLRAYELSQLFDILSLMSLEKHISVFLCASGYFMLIVSLYFKYTLPHSDRKNFTASFFLRC